MIERYTLALCILFAAAVSTGCSKYMTEVRSPAIAAPPDRAIVVFLRVSTVAGWASNFPILDQSGNWLGDAVPGSHFAVVLAPGEYVFVGLAENTAVVKASVAAGRIYYVEVFPEAGPGFTWGSRPIILEAVTPRSKRWNRLPEWLKKTTRLQSLDTGAYIRGRHDDEVKRAAAAKWIWNAYSAEEKERGTLRAEDGTPAGGVGVAARPDP